MKIKRNNWNKKSKKWGIIVKIKTKNQGKMNEI